MSRIGHDNKRREHHVLELELEEWEKNPTLLKLQRAQLAICW